mmetsp:Transcript_2578/g.8462  ORF Transcript_2578/g.8462 Transcript_2578/m.8462 type:complete len:237 (+) Transcript_2578:241-951(+)
MSITKKRGGTQYETDGATRGGKREYVCLSSDPTSSCSSAGGLVCRQYAQPRYSCAYSGNDLGGSRSSRRRVLNLSVRRTCTATQRAGSKTATPPPPPPPPPAASCSRRAPLPLPLPLPLPFSLPTALSASCPKAGSTLDSTVGTSPLAASATVREAFESGSEVVSEPESSTRRERIATLGRKRKAVSCAWNHSFGCGSARPARLPSRPSGTSVHQRMPTWMTLRCVASVQLEAGSK